MKDRDIAILGLLVVAYYFWCWKRRTGSKIAVTPTRQRLMTKPNTFGAGASTVPTSQSLVVPFTSPTAGSGANYIAAPVLSIGAANAGRRMNLGGSNPTGNKTLSKTFFGRYASFISPNLPTSQVSPTQTVKIAAGNIQVPSYAAIPTTTRGPGGGGSVLLGTSDAAGW